MKSNLKLWFILLFIILVIFSCIHKAITYDKNIVFEELTTTLYPEIDSTFDKDVKYFLHIYVVNVIDTSYPRLEFILDSFACSKSVLVNKLDTYSIMILRKSNKTNNLEIEKNPREFDRYSLGHDLLIGYQWEKDSLFFKRKYFCRSYLSESVTFKSLCPDTSKILYSKTFKERKYPYN